MRNHWKWLAGMVGMVSVLSVSLVMAQERPRQRAGTEQREPAATRAVERPRGPAMERPGQFLIPDAVRVLGRIREAFRELNLTDEQRQKIQDILENSRQARQQYMEQSREQLQNLAQQLREAIRTLNGTRAQQIVDQMRRIIDGGPKVWDTLNKIRLVLTEEQIQKLGEILAREEEGGTGETTGATPERRDQPREETPAQRRPPRPQQGRTESRTESR